MCALFFFWESHCGGELGQPLMTDNSQGAGRA